MTNVVYLCYIKFIYLKSAANNIDMSHQNAFSRTQIKKIQTIQSLNHLNKLITQNYKLSMYARFKLVKEKEKQYCIKGTCAKI